jgi:GT2 family glycosyltransferase
MLDIAVIIVGWNVRDFLANCLHSAFAEIANSNLNAEVWVVDNASTDGTVRLLSDQFPQVHLIQNDDNQGFGAANNQGMKAAAAYQPQYYFLLNPDTLVGDGALALMVSYLEKRPEAGMVGARLVYGDGRFQHSAFHFPGLVQLVFDLFPMPDRLYESRLNGRYSRHLYRPERGPFPVDHPLGATMLLRAEVFEASGGFDETYHMYCEEIDWCWRIHKAGWRIYVVPAAEVVHYGGESTKQVSARSIVALWRSRAQLYRRRFGRRQYSLAANLVKFGMRRKAAQTVNSELKLAYQKIALIWQSADGR